MAVDKERAIRATVKSAVEGYASGFCDRHISELHDENRQKERDNNHRDEASQGEQSRCFQGVQEGETAVLLGEEVGVVLETDEFPGSTDGPAVCQAGDESIDYRIETEKCKEQKTGNREGETVTGLFPFNAVVLDFSFHGKVLGFS